MKKMLVIGAILASAVHAALARADKFPEEARCAGILHDGPEHDGTVMFGGGEGEDEFICWVNHKADAKRVLAICSIGKRCEVKGLIDLCKEPDSGECGELTHLNAVSNRKGQLK